MGEKFKLLITKARDRIFAGLALHLPKQPCVSIVFSTTSFCSLAQALWRRGGSGGCHGSSQTLTGDCDEAEAGVSYPAYSERDRGNGLRLGLWRFRFNIR